MIPVEWATKRKKCTVEGKRKKTGAQRNKEGEKERETLKVEVEKAKKIIKKKIW